MRKLHIKPFNKLLIANRGEIAVRIMRACRDMGIQTVAVYSDADRGAPHVRYADEAYHIGGAQAADSYLVMERLLDVAKRSGAGAIHPGYGFLAERSAFANACYDAGLVFVGPPPNAIDVMGDKQTARETAQTAGVPIVPGTEPGISDADLLAAGNAIGFPLLVKASAGGGGKGMRPVYEASELANAIAGARREATAAFGDGTVYLERMIMGGRHIEIQVLADGHGNVVHFGERECSLQRRHQKLIEEAPSIVVTPEIRAEMGRVACAAAKAVNYVGVGTIEFLMDANLDFYFLEMNTRLQVEHPVTELVYGVDLVKEQFKAAMGETLAWDQATIEPSGWAIECRVNAEDAFTNFIPSTGLLTHVSIPTGTGVRIDTGITAGSEISPYYDSMISKLITYGANREEARTRMLRALDEYLITGVTTNIPFHRHMLRHGNFITGDFHTKYVETSFTMDDYEQMHQLEAAIAAALAQHAHTQRPAASQNSGQVVRSGWKNFGR
ncbi:MAG: acetyl-CoA carboxylase biotin carboxylase subunit [Candidatus Promineifilaceae bacterium]